MGGGQRAAPREGAAGGGWGQKGSSVGRGEYMEWYNCCNRVVSLFSSVSYRNQPTTQDTEL